MVSGVSRDLGAVNAIYSVVRRKRTSTVGLPISLFGNRSPTKPLLTGSTQTPNFPVWIASHGSSKSKWTTALLTQFSHFATSDGWKKALEAIGFPSFKRWNL